MPKFNFKAIFEKLKKSDKKTLPIFIIGIAGIFVIFISSLGNTGKDSPEENSQKEGMTNAEYAVLLEEKLLEIISNVSGVGEAKIMITLENDGEKVYANSEKKDNDSVKEYDGENINNIAEKSKYEHSVIVIDGKSGKQALIVTNLEPKVKGVVIVCEGGGNDVIKEYVTDAVKAALSLNSLQICVLPAAASEE